MPTLRKNLTSQQALDELERLYDGAVDALREAIKAFTENGTLPDATARAQGLFVYPELRITWRGDGPQQNRTRAWGRFTHTGSYSTTITRPALLRHYISEQLQMLEKEYQLEIDVGPSSQEIPYPYVIDGSDLSLDRTMSAGIARHFPTTELSQMLVMRQPMACSMPMQNPLCRTSTRCEPTSRWPACVTTPAPA
ncbi:UNVERIFIED_ORG: hypothetical protein OKW14_002902 [Pantoea brenneri]|nr:hypothetical protein [Pantoea brenneri]